MRNLLICVALWFCCGVVCAGIYLPYARHVWRSRFNYRDELGVSLFMGLILGPIAALIMFFVTGFARYGFRLPRERGDL